MGKIDSFEDISSWQIAREFNKKIYLSTEADKFKRDFDLVRQIPCVGINFLEYCRGI